MRPAFPTGEFRSLFSRWRESMPQQAQRPRSDCYAAAPTPDSLCPSVASVLQAASLHPSKEPIEQSKARSRIAASARSASAASRRESLDLLCNALSRDKLSKRARPVAPG